MRVSKLRPGFRRISILLATSAILVPVYYTHAQTSITGSQTTPVKTGGSDVTVQSGGTITITGGSAITINSNNTVDNEGTIAGNDGNNMNGILTTTGATGTITNDAARIDAAMTAAARDATACLTPRSRGRRNTKIAA